MDDQTLSPLPAAPADPQAVTPDPATAAAPPSLASRRRELTPMPATEPSATLNTTEQPQNSETPESSISTGPTEAEPAKELEPEVEKVIEDIAEHKVNGPQNVVIAAQQMPTELPKTVAEPVVVLPLSESGMSTARRKGTQTSIRWLYEWCVRQIKKIKDVLVVYRE